MRAIVWDNGRLGVHVRPCRGVLHTPPYRPRRGRRIIWGFIVYSFIPCGMIVGRIQYAPTRVHVFDRWMVRVFLGRCVLHTSLYYIQQKRTIIFRFQGHPFIPCGMVVGRMQYAPTRVHVLDRWVVRIFSGRGVLHTPLDRSRRGRRIIWEFMVYPFIPYGIVVGRIQYAPTRVRAFDR